MSSATAAECDSASWHQLTSPDNNGKGLISILRVAQGCTSPLSQQQLRSSSKGKVKMEITLCSRSPPLMNLISPPLPISSFCLAQRTSCPPSPRSREENKGALSPFSVSPFKRDGPVTLLSPSFPLRVIHIEAFTLLGCLESVPSGAETICQNPLTMDTFCS